MYKNFNLTDEERNEIMESHKSHGYKKPINEKIYDKEYDVVRGNPDFKTQTGRPIGDYVNKRAAANQFQQDFQKEFPDPGKEYKPRWEKDKPNSLGDRVDDLTPPIRFDVPKQEVSPNLSKKEELEALEKKINALELYKQEFGLDAKMTHLYYELYVKYKEALRDYNRGGVK